MPPIISLSVISFHPFSQWFISLVALFPFAVPVIPFELYGISVEWSSQVHKFFSVMRNAMQSNVCVCAEKTGCACTLYYPQMPLHKEKWDMTTSKWATHVDVVVDVELASLLTCRWLKAFSQGKDTRNAVVVAARCCAGRNQNYYSCVHTHNNFKFRCSCIETEPRFVEVEKNITFSLVFFGFWKPGGKREREKGSIRKKMYSEFGAPWRHKSWLNTESSKGMK